MHEASLHPANSFLTLTYSDENYPTDGSLNKSHFQLFMKRLRRRSSVPLRFFHCGEYGETTGRAHYHACIFGEDFSSTREFLKFNKQGDKLYRSDFLDDCWGLGYANLGDLTFESAAYVARYTLKKTLVCSGVDSLAERKTAYAKYLNGRQPEYVTMSRRPGIGAAWFGRFNPEVYPSDSVVMRGKEMLPPPFYDKLLEKMDPVLFQKIKKQRSRAAEKFANSEDSRSRRLMDREEVKIQTIKHTLNRE